MSSPTPSKRDRLAGAVADTALKLQPLLELLERIRPHVENDSVFSSRREKIRGQLRLAQEQLRAEGPRREAVTEAFRQLSEFVREEAQDVSRDEAKETAKRFVWATLKHAPGLINAAHQAGLLK